MKFYSDEQLGIDPGENFRPRIPTPEEIADEVLRNRLHTAMNLGNVEDVRRVLRLKVALRNRKITPAEAFTEAIDGLTNDLLELYRRGKETCSR